MRKPTPTTKRFACVFSTPDIKSIDDRVAELWQASFGVKAPFGDLRNQWRRQHCRTLNPYGSESCPYARASCARSFLEAVQLTAKAKPKVPVGYFRKVAKSLAAKRADQKPSTRDLTPILTSANVTRTEVLDDQGPGFAGHPADSTEEGQRLRSGEDRPFSIGDVLRSLDLRPHQRPTKDGEKSPK